MMNQDFKRENAEILLDIIKNVVSKYKAVVVVNDNPDNLSTVFAFFDKLGIDGIEYTFEIDSTTLCTLSHGNNITGASCSVQKNITIRTSDLAFYPCFRAANLGILKFGYLNFETLELDPENVELAALLYYYNPAYSNPKCDRCKYALICHKGCYIDNFIVNKDVTQPIAENCNRYQIEIDSMVTEVPELSRLFIERRNAPECTK